jgi:hypothetical protein
LCEKSKNTLSKKLLDYELGSIKEYFSVYQVNILKIFAKPTNDLNKKEVVFIQTQLVEAFQIIRTIKRVVTI